MSDLDYEWPPAARVLAGAAGFCLIALGARGAARGRAAAAWALVGSGALLGLRAATDFGLARWAGLLLSPVVDLRRTIRIDAPTDRVADFWRDFSNYPRFMSFIESVTINRRGGLRWRARGPAGAAVEWDARVCKLGPDRLAWESLPGSPIMNRGEIRFRPTDDYEGTELRVRLVYAPRAGALGSAVAHLLGFDPRARIDADLARMKEIIETSARARISTGLTGERFA